MGLVQVGGYQFSTVTESVSTVYDQGGHRAASAAENQNNLLMYQNTYL